jgi:hypothetical protein
VVRERLRVLRSTPAAPAALGVVAVGVLTLARLPFVIAELTVVVDRGSSNEVLWRRVADQAPSLNAAMAVWWLVFIAAGIAWLRWQVRRHAELRRSRVQGVDVPPALGVIVWFLPVIALVGPGIVTGRLVRAERAGPDGAVRQGEGPSLVVWFWWLTFAAGWVMCTIGAIVRGGAGTFVSGPVPIPIRAQDVLGNLRAADVLLTAGSVLLVVAAPLAIAVLSTAETYRASASFPWTPARPDPRTV